MENLIADIRRIMADESEAVSLQWMRNAMQKHPYFTLPLLLYLKRNPDCPDRENLLARLAIAFPDRKELALQLGDGVETYVDFYSDEPRPQSPDTDTTIDRFLVNYGSASQKEISALEQAIFNPMPDYADILAAQETEVSDEREQMSQQDRLINDFISKSQEQEQRISALPQQHVQQEDIVEIADAQVDVPAENDDDSMLSESLAKIYISKRKYSQALEIIQNISLIYPEKSIYFADQIRFLKKLVFYQNITNKK